MAEKRTGCGTFTQRVKITPIQPDREVIHYILTNQVKADPVGVNRMLPKAGLRALFMEGLTSYEANILKQEALSVGGDLGISRGAILKNRRCEKALLLVTEKQLDRLVRKLEEQGFPGLKALVQFYRQGERRIWRCRDKELVLEEPVLMGIVNLTPDSFSGDGVLDPDEAVERATNMVSAGAKILDLGAESSRPGARPVSVKEEMARLLPVLRRLRKEMKDVVLSVDTYKVEVAKAAVEEGADVVNDITGVGSPRMRALIKRHRLGAVIMHMKGRPATMQRNPLKGDVVGRVYEFLRKRVEEALREGISEDQLVVDPGIGFGKRWEDNYSLLRFVGLFSTVRPVLVGISRKSFIGHLTGSEVSQRLPGTIAGNLYAYSRGASIFRVHDVEEHQQAFRVWLELSR